MRKIFYFFILVTFLINILGCIPLIVGAAAGGAGVYATSQDTIQGYSDKPYEQLWNSALTIGRARGAVKKQDDAKGSLELEVGRSSRAWITLTKLTDNTTRVKVAARKHHLPDINLAEDIYTKIIEGVK